MTENQRFSESAPEDDVEGHGYRWDADTWGTKDDVEGHSFTRTLDTQTDEDDVEGHLHSGAIRPDIYGDAGRTP